MPPGSISMTMKAPGVCAAHGYNVFDGKLVNGGRLVLRLKMSGAEKSTVVFFIYSVFFIQTFITPFLKSVAFHCFVFVNHCCLYAIVRSEFFPVEQKSIGSCVFHVKIVKVSEKTKRKPKSIGSRVFTSKKKQQEQKDKKKKTMCCCER